MGLRRSIDIIRRRRWSVIACAVLAGGVAGGLSAVRTPTYTAEARVRVLPVASSTAPAGLDGSAIPSVSDRELRAFVERATSATVTTQAVAGLPRVDRHAAHQLAARRIDGTDQVVFVATTTDRVRTVRTANAFARAAIAARRREVVSELQRAASALGPQLASVKARLGNLDSQSRARSATSSTTAQVNAAAAEYEALQTRQADLQRAADAFRTGATVTRPATVQATTDHRTPWRDAAIGGAIGLLLGLGLALARELLDERVHSTEDIERATGLPVLAELPRDRRAKQQPSRVAVVVSPRSALSEATRALRAGIELRDVGRHTSSILVTSAASGEGKSLVGANLAAAYAVAGYRTVLIDADLRTPRLSSMFGTYPGPLIATGEVVHGLSSLLQALKFPGTDRAALEQAALLRTPVENLFVLPSGPEPSNPAELLDSRAMAELLHDLGAFAEVVIIDAPPLLPVSDAFGLARHADGVVVVAAVGESSRRALRRISLMLAAHPRVLGIVANKVAPRAAYATYSPRRRGAAPLRAVHPATGGTLRVVRPIAVAMPPTGTPDANGDVWIDLTEDTDPYLTVREGELQLNSWGR